VTGNHNTPKRRNTLITIHGLITQQSGNEAIIFILSHINPLPIPLHWEPLYYIIWSPSNQRLGLTSGLFPACFPTKTTYVLLFLPTCVICPVHHILLDLLTRVTFGEVYRPLPRGHRLIAGTFSVGRGGLRVPMKLGATLVGPTKPDRFQPRGQTKCVPQR
jgi:hypothetical protein